MAKLLEVKNLKTYFYTDDGIAKAVDDIDYDLDKGETLGLVGESGCGKSVSALSIMRLIPDPPGKIVGGQIMFKGQDLQADRKRNAGYKRKRYCNDFSGAYDIAQSRFQVRRPD